MTAAPPLERAIRQQVVRFYRSLGLKVWNLDQGFRPGGPRHGTTRQSKGLADLFVTGRGRCCWHELKRPVPWGDQSPEQQGFEYEVRKAGLPYAIGGMGAALLVARDVFGFMPARMDSEPGDRLGMPFDQDAPDAGQEA